MNNHQSQSRGFWQRLLAKYAGISILGRPDSGWGEDANKDYLMMFHYCRNCRQFRFDRFFDPLSKSARFSCAGCGQTNAATEGPGVFWFKILDCVDLASQLTKSKCFFWLLFFRFMTFGLGKHMPDDRGGKTAGELETEATIRLGSAFMSYVSTIGSASQ